MINRDRIEKFVSDFRKTSSPINKKKAISFLCDKHGLSYGEASKLVQPISSTKSFTGEQLFWVVEAISESDKGNPNQINIYKYYSPVEIDKYSNSFANSTKADYPIDLGYVLPLDSETYIGTMTIQQIKQLFDWQVVIYDFEEQRNPRIKKDKKTGETLYQININKKSVKDITELIETGKYIPDEISFNFPKLANSSYSINAQGHLFLKEGYVNIVDGYHRVCAILKALDKNPNIKLSFPVRFSNYSKSKCQRFIRQKSIINELPESFKEYLNQDNVALNLVKQMNESGDFPLKGNITFDSSLVAKGLNGLALARFIEYIYEVNEKTDNLYNLEIYSKVSGQLKSFIMDNPTIIDTHMSHVNTIVIMFCLKNGVDNRKILDICKAINIQRHSNRGLRFFTVGKKWFLNIEKEIGELIGEN